MAENTNHDEEKINQKLYIWFTRPLINFFIYTLITLFCCLNTPHLLEMGFGPLGTSCSPALNTFSCHLKFLRRPLDPLLRPDSWANELTFFDLPVPCEPLVEYSMAVFLIDPPTPCLDEWVTDGIWKLCCFLAMVVWNMKKRKRRKKKTVGSFALALAMQNISLLSLNKL